MGKAARRLIDALRLRTVGSRIAAVCFVNCIVLAVSILILFSRVLSDTQIDNANEKLETDLNYLQDMLALGSEPEWYIEDGMIYCSGRELGDGTVENAHSEVFLDVKEKTGSFSYVFIKTSDDNLTYVGDDKTGYMQGHYMRVTGSTLGYNGQEIIGTYMDKKVADVLDETGYYIGQANVDGSQIYCIYKTVLDKDGNIAGCIVVGRSMTDIAAKSKISTSMLVIIIGVILLANIGILLLNHFWTDEISDLDKYLKRIGNGELPDEPLKMRSDDEIGDIADSVNDMVKALKEKDRMGAELKLASDLQQGLLPRIFPPFPEYDTFDIYATMTPAREIGGDFYDMFKVDDTKIAFVIGDVSGKGVPAAIIMAVAKTFIRNLCKSGMAANEVYKKANTVFADDNDASYFITSWLGILDITTGHLQYCNAGHNPPLVTHGENGTYEYVKARSGLVLGAMPGSRYKLNELQMRPGDKLFLYTDGVTEANNNKKELYGEERLKEFLDRNNQKEMPIIERLELLKEDIDIFIENEEQFDDITMLILEYKENANNQGHSFIGRKFPAQVAKLDEVLGFVEEELSKNDCPPKVMMQIALSLEEVFVNVANYAYPEYTEGGEVLVEIKATDEKAVIRLIDSGIPFNPLGREDPDVTLSAEERKIGGLGIYLTKKQMDDVTYERKDDKNILILEKVYG